jgi:fibronectin type 3 domain-containing protein
MDQLTYQNIAEVSGRLEAEMIESYLEAQGIDVELIQESIGHSIYPVTVDGLGRVQIFVPKEKVIEARKWLIIYREGIQEE